MSVTVIYEFRATDGKASKLLDLLQQARAFGLTVDGCEDYDVYQGKDDPGRFVIVETWVSVAAHHDHFEKNVQASGILDTAVGLMAQAPALAEPYHVRVQ